MRHGVLHDELGLPELRIDNKFACLCGQGFDSLELLGEHITRSREGEPPPTGYDRKSELDGLLNRLLDAERSVAFYQQAAADIRERILQRFGMPEKEPPEAVEVRR